ncbi:MAG: serine/threonine-protein kinase [Bacteroidota bacterium]
MTSARWLQVKTLFEEALAQPPEARAAFLETACDEEALRREVDSLLEAAEETGPVDRLEEAWARPIAEAHGAADTPPVPAAPAAEQRVGPYQIVQVLGRGGMGTVYLAERADGQFEQTVALKVVREGMDSPALQSRFLAERRVLARLQHPGIARLLDGGLAESGQPYFAMERLEGERLDDYCDARCLRIAERLQLFGQVCEAVHHAHRHLVIHRDLKPSNILVTDDGTVKLLDFGIAKLLEDAGSDAPTQTIERVLTPGYAAPEQIRGLPVSTAADVYSLGVVLYELLTGCRPYEVGTLSPAELERVICETEPPRPSTRVTTATDEGDATPGQISQARSTAPETLGRRLAGDLDTIVLKALAKEPERRYASAEALLEDLQRHLDGLPVRARPPTVRYRARKFVRRNALGVSLVALLMLALGAGLAGTAWQARVAAAERDTARREAATAEQVTDYLVEVFGASDPWQNPEGGRGEEVTARQLLEQGAEQLERLEGDPAVQAAVMDALGSVYYRIGMYEKAQPLLERALAERRALWGDAHEEVVESLTRLSDLFYETGAYDRVEALDREALALRRQLFGDRHLGVAASLNNLAALLYALGEHDEAESMMREALALRRQLLGDDHPELAETLGNLAVMLRTDGAYGESEALQREALALYRELHGDDHPTIATSLNNVAAVLRDKLAYEEAEQFQREALAMNRRLLGDDHPYVATSLNNLAGLLHEAGADDQAVPIHREALALRRQFLGDDHPDVAQSLSNLAGSLRGLGLYDEAETSYREALAVRRQALGGDHPDVASSLNNLAELYRFTSADDRAEPLYREALAIYQERLGDDHVLTSKVLHGLGLLLVDNAGAVEAEPLLRRSLETQLETFGDRHAGTAEARTALGRCLTALGGYEEAKRQLEAAIAFYESAGGNHEEEYEEALAALDAATQAR